MSTIFTVNNSVILRNGIPFITIDVDGNFAYVSPRMHATRCNIAALREAGANLDTIERFRNIDRSHEANRRPRMVRVGIDPRRTFGIEIECFKPGAYNFRREVAAALCDAGIEAEYHERYHEGNHRNPANWMAEYDISITGDRDDACECISPVLRGQAGLDQVVQVMDIIRSIGGKVNAHCGLHVHHGAKYRKIKPVNVLDFFRNNEGLIDSVLAPSRRENRNEYCRSMARCVDLASWARQGKYSKLNYAHYSDLGTLEFRCHQGSLNGQKAVNWIKLTQAMMVIAEVSACSSLEEMLTKVNIEPEVKDYYLRKAEAFVTVS